MCGDTEGKVEQCDLFEVRRRPRLTISIHDLKIVFLTMFPNTCCSSVVFWYLSSWDWRPTYFYLLPTCLPLFYGGITCKTVLYVGTNNLSSVLCWLKHWAVSACRGFLIANFELFSELVLRSVDHFSVHSKIMFGGMPNTCNFPTLVWSVWEFDFLILGCRSASQTCKCECPTPPSPRASDAGFSFPNSF